MTAATAALSLLASTDLRAAESCGAVDYPAIVVGSGYGGSVAAFYLGNARVKTLVLERGRDWTVRDPTKDATFATLETVTAPGGDVRSTWMNTKCIGNTYLSFGGPFPCPVGAGILEEMDDSPETHRDASPALKVNGVKLRVAAGVGGGSLVNGGVAFAPTKQGWDAAFPPNELPLMQQVWADLKARYFRNATIRLGASPTPSDILATEYYRGTRTFAAFAAAAGYPEENPADPATWTFNHANMPTIADWNKVRDEIAGRRVASMIRGEVYWGSNSGAKKSLEQPDGYLGRAVSTGHVTVKPLHTVTGITYDPHTRIYKVAVTHTDESYHVLSTRSFTTRHVFMAAGSVGSTKLLVRARDTGALPNLNAHVGTRWTTNGDMAHFRIVSSTFLPQGGPAGEKITDFRDPSNPVIIEAPPLRAPAFFASDPNLQPFFGALLNIAFGVPTAKGTFRYDAPNDTVVLDWPPDGAANIYQRVTSILTDPAFPGTPVIVPQARSQGSSFHPLGGVPLGLATDAHCRLRGYRGLYAVDGAILPGPSAVANPSLLISALAERCMAHLAPKIAEDNDDDDNDDDK
ncbi:GMC oxidoreductase [Pendulispora albinea]|uniref:Cholesterol oxidase n=1 Tax=Pendulispora albinea TaxID=2741071 RepID=A0ABZ2LTL7_9BACT